MKTTSKSFSTYLVLKIFRLISILASVLFLSSCCQDSETYMVPESFKQYFYFPAGSWWVYKNQFGVFDTLSIQSVESEIERLQVEDCNKFERLSIKYHSTVSGDMKAGIVCRDKDVFFFCFSNPENCFFNNITNMPILAGNEHRSFACNSQIDWSMVDLLRVGELIYSDVYFNQSIFISQMYDTYPVNCFFAKNVGLIKKELKNGQIWELVDYRINK